MKHDTLQKTVDAAMKTQTEWRQEWVAALRSGKFEQGRYSLCWEQQYCCLGVACEISKEHLDLTKIDHGDGCEYNNQRCGLPTCVADLFGIRTPYGDYTGSSLTLELLRNTNSLTAKNDSGYTFDQIADIIESEPEGLFL